MEEARVSRSEPEVEDSPIPDNPREFLNSGGDASQCSRIISVDRLTVEKIVLENDGSLEVLLTKSESSKKLSERTTRLPAPKSRSSLWRRRASSTDELPTTSRIQRLKLVNDGILTDPKKSSSLSNSDHKSGSSTSLNSKRISPIRLTKSSSIGSLVRFNRAGKSSTFGKIRKIPPKVPAKPLKKKHLDVPYFGPVATRETIKNSTSESWGKVPDRAKLHIVDNSAEAREPLERSQSEIGRLRQNLRTKINATVQSCKRNSVGPFDNCEEASDRVSVLETRAHERLERSHSEIGRLQRNLRTKINASTAETYKQKLPGLQASPVKISPIADLDLNENVTETPFDKEFLERHSFDTELKIEEKRLLVTDIDYVSDIEKSSDCGKPDKPKYSRTVSEIERRWSGEFLENNFQQNSSESSYVEELGSVSSRESVNGEASGKYYNGRFPQKSDRQIEDRGEQRVNEEILEDTVSTVDSDSCLEDRIKAIDEDIDKAAEGERGEEERSNAEDSNGLPSFLKRSSPRTCVPENLLPNLTAEKSKTEEKSIDLEKNCLKVQRSELSVTEPATKDDQSDSLECSSSPDGYASLIKEFAMEACSSKYGKEEKKKKSGLRRLLPGIFSPRDSRKEYKKEQKERKKREEKHFNQHQQNGIYTRSPDTMNLNEDITRNVKLDTSLNGSIIEERLNEIKQELFPDQGMTTSTPDHFLQGERTIGQEVRSARSFTVNSSLSSIAPDDKWLDHNIISGSPDMRKFKQQMRNENERKCSLERKHSLQESTQPRFMRNHGASGRISAPPGERFLIRPRAVHPVDRPLPAIPQKVEFSNYQNHEEIMKHPSYFGTVERPEALTNYQADSYLHMTGNRNYENGNHVKGKTEMNRNQSIDSEFNLTPVSAQVKITRQLIVNQNQKAPLIGRSPKYSPSSSQKSGDYADSSYTPNSSQKSEFSPGSSKSGEYYLNSPRNSCRTSPDESFTDRRDQQPSHVHRNRINEDQEESTHPVPYPVSPKIRVQSKDDRYYDGASPTQEGRLDKLAPNSRHSVGQANSPQEAIYVTQRGSANIPMSSNLAKLRANVENTTTAADGAVNVDRSFGDNSTGKDGSRITASDSSFGILASPVQFRDSPPQKEDKDQRAANLSPPRATTPSRIQRIASPLTILTPGSPSQIPSSVASPNQSRVIDGSMSPSNSRSMTSPRNLVQTSSPQSVQRRSSNQSTQPRPPVSSPNVNQSRTTPSSGPYSPMSTFNSRRAQPNDQILIASPKRDASIYEARANRSSSKMESDCPDSPVPMAESPSHVSIPRSQISRRNAVDRTKSPISDVSGSEELLKEPGDGKQSSQLSQRASPVVREIVPLIDGKIVQKNIQRPEPIYVKQPGVQRVMSPLLIRSEGKRDDSPVAFAGESRPDTLLVSVRQEIGTRNRSTLNPRKLLQDIDEASQQSVNGISGQREIIYVERRVQSPSGTARSHPQRPEVIYVQREQNLSPDIMRELDSSVSSRQSGGHQHDKELNRSLEHVQMETGSGVQNNEGIYNYRKPDRFRDSPVNEQIYGTRASQQSPIPVSVRSPSGSYRRTQDVVGVEPNRGPAVTKLSEQQQKQPQQHHQQQQQLQQQQQQIYASRRAIRAEDQQQVSPANRQSATKDPTYIQRQSPKQQEPIYTQRSSEPIYGQRGNRQLSPSKRQMMQHLEAFYWQQKALDSQRKSMNSPTLPCRGLNDGKIDSPEVREAIYWQQLKKLDEEQQRRIFEENQMEEKSDPLYWRKKLQGSLSPSHPVNPTRHGSAPSLASQNLSLVPVHQNQQHSDNSEHIYWQNKMQQVKSQIPVGKPPAMGQKGQNQPVLVVRPQQAVREVNRTTRSPVYDQRDGVVGQDKLRSKSVSPHFARGDERRSLSLPRKPDLLSDEVTGSAESNSEAGGPSVIGVSRKTATPSIYEEHDSDGKKPLAPPPIFKRGSLISNSSSSVEYGTMGPKRVSFSNQPNSPEVGAGNWPTKHGMAPEPPTRKHRTEERISETMDSAFLHCHENHNNSNNIYGNVVDCAIERNARIAQNSPLNEQRNIVYETEYDAKPLPPPPRDSSWTVKRSSSMKDNTCNSGRIPRIEIQRAKVPANQRKWPGVSESESGSEAGEVQRILHLRNEEEWNPGGKGRQSNDTGGSGRAEGEGGSNDLAGGRRGVGILGGGRGSGTSGSGGGGAGGRSRDEPRRHTLSGDHQPSLHHQQFNTQQLHPLHPHHLPPLHGQYGTPPTRHTTMDLEMGTKSRQRKSPLPRVYPPPSSTMLFDDDPGIMSEVETSSTGFRRGGKQRSSLPVVRTPSKTLERPLGLVFLQYRNETKRALLPNEITSIDTVKALFVRSFPKQLTMEYLDSPHVKVYIHDSNKDMFYELEDLRSHLRDIRDRSVLRLFESTDGVAGMPGPMGGPAGGTGLPPHWEDQSYFSEPEFDSEFQHQHIHKSKTAKNSSSGSSGYYVGGSSTLPRGGPLMRAYSPAASTVVAGPNATPTQPKGLSTPGGGGVAPAKPLRSYQCGKSPLGSLGGSARFSRDSSVSLYSIPDRLHGESGYMSSPERGGGAGTGSGRYPGAPYSTGSSYEEPYYSQYSGTVTPVIDEEASDTELLEESYSLYGVKPPGRPPSGPPRSPFPPGAPALPPGQPYDVTRIRVEQMERQLANLTGLVQKALTHPSHTSPSPRDYLQVPAGRDPYTRTTGAGDEFDKHSSSSSASLPDDSYLRTDVKPPKLGKDKSVSFEKSVSFSDEPPDMNSPKQHSPQHAADTKPTKPAIKSSTLPRMSSQERDRHKPTPPPKPVALAAGQYVYRDLALTPEMYNQLRGLQKKAKDLRQEVRNLRRMSQAQAHTVRETIRDTFITIRAMLLSGGDAAWAAGDTEKMRLSREEDLYKQEMIRLEKDLTELESTVEELRGNVINRKTRVNMSDVENMALILSKSSKTVADLKVRFPSLQEGMKGLLSSEMEKVVREEKFLNEEPERLESALRRCKKLTGTLVTLKRLASVQEQRSPNAASVDAEETPPITPTSAQHSKTTAPVPAERTVVGSAGIIGGGSHALESSAPHQQRPENALDALLDELQTFSRPASQMSQASGAGPPSNHMPNLLEIGRSASQIVQSSGRAPCMSDIGRKGSIDSSTSLAIMTPGHSNTLRRLHSYPSSSDTDTSPPIARLQVSDGSGTGTGTGPAPQKPPVPERNAELLQLATARRVPPPPPPRTSSRSPLASPTSPQLPPRNPTGTLRRGRANAKEGGKPPMALPANATSGDEQITPNNMLSTSNSSSCESINSQEGLQNKKGRQEQLELRHQELLRKQKALQEQYARLQQLQRNASGLTTVPPAPPDLLKKTGSESNLLAKMGLGLSTTTSGSLTSLATKPNADGQQSQQADLQNAQSNVAVNQTTTSKIYETDIL